MEVAAVLAQKGIAVTMVLNEERLGKRLFSQPTSAFFEGYYAARGVQFIKSATVTGLSGDGAVREAVVGDGPAIPCDMVVAGIGVRPVTEILEGSGIEVSD